MSIIDLVPLPYRLAIQLAIVALLVSVIGAQTWRLHSAQAAFAAKEVAWAQAVASQERDARIASDTYREKERVLASTNERIRHDREEDAKRNDAAAAVLHAVDDRLRDKISGFAAGGSAPTGDTIAACNVRAAALGDLLVDGLRVQAALAAGAEDRLADARGLRGWAEAVRTDKVTP